MNAKNDVENGGVKINDGKEEMSEGQQERERQEAVHRMARRREEMLEDERFQCQQIHVRILSKNSPQRLETSVLNS